MKPLQANERSERPGDLDLLDAAATGNKFVRRESDRSRFQQSLMATRRSLLLACDLKSIQAVAVSHLRNTCQPVLIAWNQAAGSQIGQSDRLEGLLCPMEGISESLLQQLHSAAAEAVHRNEVTTSALSDSLCLISMPVPSFPGHCLLTVAECADNGGDYARELTTSLLLLSSFVEEWAIRRDGAQAAKDALTVAALIELVGHVQTADDATAACQRLADSLQQHLSADKVVVGLCRSGASECRVVAISNGAVVDRFSEETRLVESVLQESLIRSAGAVWPVLDQENRHALLSHQQLAESGFGRTLVSVPIQTETGSPIGAILVVFSPPNEAVGEVESIREAERFLRAGTGVLAGCLSVLQKLADSRWLQWTQRIRRSLTASRLQVAGWVTAGLAVIMLLPMTYTVRCSLELQPMERRYVAAPFDGPLEECLVEPGDVVVRNQLLARMDGREIRWELAEVQANLNKATKERNTQVSSREFGAAAVLGHEIQRLEQRMALLVHRDASLEIRSPADGVVVSGDHRETEGVPLETGQTLFEIAPLNAMVVELCIPEDDIRHVREGMNVVVQLDAVPEQSIEATIRSIQPRAELRDGDNVFIAEADIPNADTILRPGMRGSAKVSTGRHLLGWNLFHKPAAWLLGWLGW